MDRQRTAIIGWGVQRRGTYQDSGGGVVDAGARGREADAAREVVDAVGPVKVGRHERRQAERLGDEVRGQPPVAEPAGGARPARHVAAVGREVGAQRGGDLVVVARVHRRVPEHDHRRHPRRRGPRDAARRRQQQKQQQQRRFGPGTAGRRRHWERVCQCVCVSVCDAAGGERVVFLRARCWFLAAINGGELVRWREGTVATATTRLQSAEKGAEAHESQFDVSVASSCRFGSCWLAEPQG